jgi:hypothetical protein
MENILMQMHRSQLRSWWNLYYRKTATFLKFEISDDFFFVLWLLFIELEATIMASRVCTKRSSYMS